MFFQKVLKSPKKLAIKIWTCFSTTTRKIQCTQLRNVASVICRWLSYERKVHARFNTLLFWYNVCARIPIKVNDRMCFLTRYFQIFVENP